MADGSQINDRLVRTTRFYPTRDGRVVAIQGDQAEVWTLDDAKNIRDATTLCAVCNFEIGQSLEAVRDYVRALDDAYRRARFSKTYTRDDRTEAAG